MIKGTIRICPAQFIALIVQQLLMASPEALQLLAWTRWAGTAALLHAACDP
jgi:hypothetical protein